MKKEVKELNRALHETGQLDCLSYYIKVFSKMKNFVGNRPIATKTFIPKGRIKVIHRGSDDPPLYISDLLKLKKSFLKLRVGKHLKDVENKLSEKEKLIWRYFVPRKFVEMHYACNYEGAGEPVDRIFIDIDKGKNISYADYFASVKELIFQIKSDKDLRRLINFKSKFIWTGKSIHVYLLLSKKQKADFYEKYFSFSSLGRSTTGGVIPKRKDREISLNGNLSIFNEDTFISKWAKEVSSKTGVSVAAGHERKNNKIILDSSSTPSGKLARCPYSLHLSRIGELDGKSFFLKEKDIVNQISFSAAFGFLFSPRQSPERRKINLACYIRNRILSETKF